MKIIMSQVLLNSKSDIFGLLMLPFEDQIDALIAENVEEALTLAELVLWAPGTVSSPKANAPTSPLSPTVASATRQRDEIYQKVRHHIDTII
jgi:hypothetical protein